MRGDGRAGGTSHDTASGGSGWLEPHGGVRPEVRVPREGRGSGGVGVWVVEAVSGSSSEFCGRSLGGAVPKNAVYAAH